MILLTNLPIDTSNFYAPHYSSYVEGETYQGAEENIVDVNNPPKGWWKKELDKKRGRNRPRQTVSLDEFVSDASSKRKRVK
jgi:hypothetical protein